MPFGFQIVVQTQAQEDAIIDGFVKAQGPIPMSAAIPAVLDEQGNVVTPAVPSAPLFTPKQFASKKLKEYAVQVAKNGKASFASNAAFDAALVQAESDLADA